MTKSKKQILLLVILSALIALQSSEVRAADAKKAAAPKAEAAKKEAAPSPSPAPEATPAATPTPAASPTPVEEVKKEEAKPAEEKKEDGKKELYGKKNRLLGDFVVGPYVTLVSVPRPISFGIEAKWWDLIGVSGSYGFFPQLKLGEVTLKITGTEGRFKIYPFRGSFFLGVGFGSQTFTGSSTKEISTVSVTGTVSQKNNFIAPQIGWNWCWDSGFFMGLDLGVQLSMSRTTTFTTNVTDPLITGSAEYEELENDVTEMAEMIGKTPLPLLTLIKIGYFF